jgi:hypothetical protein
LPAPEEVERGIHVTYRTAAMLSQADVEEDHLAAELFREARAKAAARTSYHDEVAEGRRRIAREEEEAEKRVIREREWATRERIRAEAREREVEVQEREIALQTMREEVRADIRRLIADTMDPVEEAILKERAALHQGLAEVVEVVRERGYVHGKTAEKVRNLVERYRDFGALLDDEDLAPKLNSLEEALERRVPHPDREGATQVDAAGLTQHAAELIRLTADAARKLAQGIGGTRAGALMI